MSSSKRTESLSDAGVAFFSSPCPLTSCEREEDLRTFPVTVNGRTRRRPRRAGRALIGAHSQAALPVLLPDLLGDPQLPGETLGGGAASARGGARSPTGGAGDSEGYVVHRTVTLQYDFSVTTHDSKSIPL